MTLKIRQYDYIILGAGASGLMMAYRMAKDPFFDESSILIIDKEKDKGNDRTWSFWEEGQGEWDDCVIKAWSKIYFGSSYFSKTFKGDNYNYKTIRSSDFYSKIWDVLQTKTNIEFLQSEVVSIQDLEDKVEVQLSTSTVNAKRVLNSLMLSSNYKNQDKYPLLNQHFLGWFIKTKTPQFDDSVATFMDFDLPQNGNTRFMYVLPFAKDYALFEYTLFSEDILDISEYESSIKDYLKMKGIDDYDIIETEFGIIPMTSYKFNKENTENVIHIGTAGGWTKASTGFTFMKSWRQSSELTEFLKTRKSFKSFHKRSKFWFYDLIFLDVLYADNAFGSRLFSSLFQKTSLKSVFRFLDEQSHFSEDLKIIAAVPPNRFIRAFFKRLF
ncbi:lycopene cyclase family protein [Winogradskyella maritima]|uniref:Lycopene cyclase family protein n=1 Tax=Winogradskyella maritima TaxID=1517766 RepID=A0ABV8AIU5_9FLAO|nr:lycopene cyclase family protein [Winogradskyella maritima]